LEGLENCEEEFLRLRKTLPQDPLLGAARFIYLNRTAFNGIYRVNKKGLFNVPYGRPDVAILEREKILEASRALQKTSLSARDFGTENKCKKNDFVFLDPPYSFGGKQAFISYNSKVFSLNDQKRLASLVENLESKGIAYVLTNSAHVEVEELFSFCKHRAVLSRREYIAADPTRRKMAKEMIFSNIEGFENVIDG
jgi:DNA adenine methylase